MKIMFVDDEMAAAKRFRVYAEKIGVDKECTLFDNPSAALAYVEEGGKETVDIAILDIEMPNMSGIELARKLHEIDRSIRVIFITGYHEYALDAFSVDAVGYLTKPYTMEQLENELAKAERIGDYREKKLYIQTIPSFDVYLDGDLLPLPHNKQKELLALMVDRQGSSLSVGDIICNLWEDKPDDDKTKSLVRVTFMRLKETLTQYGIVYILNTNMRAVYPDTFACDYYRLMKGNDADEQKYHGAYMQEYEWAEETNARIGDFLDRKKKY